MGILFFVHVIATLFMTAICWFIQLVHYPLFREIKLSDFSNYEVKNVFLTALIAVPIMIVESLTGLYLLYIHQDFLHFTNVFFLIIIGVSTFIFQAPIHLKLMSKASPELLSRLIRTNWIRTISWTIRCGIIVYWISFLI